MPALRCRNGASHGRRAPWHAVGRRGTADKLMTVDEKWLHKNRDHGMMSAAASLGLILLWDVDEGLSQVRPSGSVPCAANK